MLRTIEQMCSLTCPVRENISKCIGFDCLLLREAISKDGKEFTSYYFCGYAPYNPILVSPARELYNIDSGDTTHA